MISVDHFLLELRGQFIDAQARGAKHIVISASELCIAVGLARPPSAADLIRCKQAMQNEVNAGDVFVNEGQGFIDLIVRYALPRRKPQ